MEEQKTKESQNNKVEETKKVQAVSKTYTLSAFGKNIQKLHEIGLINNHEKTKAEEILKSAKLKYLDQL